MSEESVTTDLPREEAPPAVSPAAGDQRSTSQVLRDVVTETQTLIRQELELARQEMMDALNARLMAAGAAAAGGLMALFALAFAGVTIAMALQRVMAPWLAWLIVTVAYLVVAGAALLVARSLTRSVPMKPERAKASIEENVQWAKHQLKR